MSRGLFAPTFWGPCSFLRLVMTWSLWINLMGHLIAVIMKMLCGALIYLVFKHLISQMVEMVCLHVISLMEALQECNSTIFVKVGKMDPRFCMLF